MPVLRPNLIPSLGLPNEIVAPPQKRRNAMNQPAFYKQPGLQQDPQAQRQSYESQVEPENLGFDQDPVSGDYISAQLKSYGQRAAVPSLEPGARVRAPKDSLVDPANFESFYQQLGITEQLGETMLSAAQARKEFARQKSLMDVLNQQVQSPGSVGLKGGNAGGGQSFGNGIPSNPQANFRFAQEIGPRYGWTGNELSAWYTLGMKESGWRNTAQNPTSTAYGIGQFLNSTWAGVGIGKTSDPATQVEAMARYIRNRYGSPSRALAFHLKNNWY